MFDGTDCDTVTGLLPTSLEGMLVLAARGCEEKQLLLSLPLLSRGCRVSQGSQTRAPSETSVV